MRNVGRMVILAVAVLAFLAVIGAGVRETEGASMVPVPRHGGQIFNDHEYLLVAKELTWQDAKKACEAAGGHLVTITGVSENTFVSGILGGSKYSWIGFTDEAKEGDWRWVTGERVAYTNWHSGQPDNDGGEDYGMMYRDGTWNDTEGSHTHYYVCEWG